MNTAKELYPEPKYQDDDFYGPCDYLPILKSFGEIVVKVDDEDYQGDSRVLYRDGDRIGWLQFGWGSCSGCDALQACSNYMEIDKLIEELRSQIKWFDCVSDALNFFEEHDWEGDYSYHSDEQKSFIEKVKEYLKK